MLNKQSVAMVRRIVVLASFALLGGCRHNTHVVRLIVHGPVVTAPTNEGTIIVVPAVDPGDLQHFLATGYPSVGEAASTPCPAGAYEFSLKGFKPVEKKAGANTNNGDVIEPAFDPITFTRANWKPWKNQPYFVTMDLPAATKIAALGERYPVQFQSGPAFVPLTQVLEFEVRDSDDVRLVRTCGSEKKEYKALSCKEMQARYDQAFEAFKDLPDAANSRRYIDFALKSCTDDASYLFVGIGTKTKDLALSVAHGSHFFNSKILPEIYGGKENVPQDRKIVESGQLGPKGGGGGGDYRGVRLIQTSFDGEDPLYRPVAMVENCTAPGGFVRP